MTVPSSNQEAFWGAALVVIIGLSLLSVYASRRRLKEWAEAEGVRILTKTSGLSLDAPEEISYRARRTGGAYYVTVEDSEKNIFSAWVDVGGIFAALFDRHPIVIWDNRPAYLRK